MKKILSFILAAVMLLSATAISAYAAADIEISMSDAEGKPGDIVEVNIYYDKNAGAYASYFYVHYDSRCFEFVERVSGEIFSDGETMDFAKDGVYTYYGSNNGIENTLGTGLLATLKFKILKAAPNGEYELTLKPHEDIGGYFFDVTDIYATEYPARTVEVKNSATITVTGSDAESLPETTTPPETEAATEKETGKVTKPVTDKKDPVTEIVTEFVTDAEGEVVTDVAGDPVVTDVVVTVPEKVTSPEAEETVKDPETEIVYVTDADGEQVTDVAGDPVTEIVEVEDKAPVSMNMIVIIVCVAAIVAAAVITVVVITSRKKNDEDNSSEE